MIIWFPQHPFSIPFSKFIFVLHLQIFFYDDLLKHLIEKAFFLFKIFYLFDIHILNVKKIKIMKIEEHFELWRALWTKTMPMIFEQIQKKKNTHRFFGGLVYASLSVGRRMIFEHDLISSYSQHYPHI